MSRKSSSPFNKLISDERRSSTKTSKVSERGLTIRNFFLHYHRIINKSQPNLNINFEKKDKKLNKKIINHLKNFLDVINFLEIKL